MSIGQVSIVHSARRSSRSRAIKAMADDTRVAILLYIKKGCNYILGGSNV